MINFAINIGYFFVTLAIIFCFIRLIIGPKIADRILAIDTMYINTVVLLVIFSIDIQSMTYFVVAVLIACLGFAGTIALSKFLLRGNIME